MKLYKELRDMDFMIPNNPVTVFDLDVPFHDLEGKEDGSIDLKKDTPKVFLSHNSKDKHVVWAIAKKLKLCGFDYWLDETDLLPGYSPIESIRKAIDDGRCCTGDLK